MKNKFLAIIGIIGVITLSIILTISFIRFGPQVDQTLGSNTQGNDYFGTSTQNNTNALVQTIQNYAVIKSGQGTLAQVTITGANTGTFTLYDATSTVTNTLWGTTTLATFPASATAGTYTFDEVVQKGILIQYSGLLASATIMYR